MAQTAAPIRRTWIKPPRWVGLCNDGYGLASDGRWYFQQRPPELDRLRQFREMQFDTITRTVGEVVDEWLAAGKLPFLSGLAAPSAMGEAKNALLLLPRSILRALITGRAEIAVEPEAYFRTSSIFSDDSGRAAGLANGRTARVAGDCGDVRQVVLHEAGHIVDALRSRFWLSHSPEWLGIWKGEKAAGRVPSDGDYRLRIWAAEYFAECFSKHFGDSAAGLSPAVGQFMASLEARFA